MSEDSESDLVDPEIDLSSNSSPGSFPPIPPQAVLPFHRRGGLENIFMVLANLYTNFITRQDWKIYGLGKFVQKFHPKEGLENIYMYPYMHICTKIKRLVKDFEVNLLI